MGKGQSMLAVVLLFVWTSAPALRCLIPGESLTAEDQACCKSMGGECGDSAASDHPCCKKTTSTSQPALATAQASSAAAVPVAAAVPQQTYLLTEQEFAAKWLVDPSPPLLQQANPVLRI